MDRLRDANRATIPLVAILDEEVVGHILLSPITIEFNPENLRGLGLAPIAGLPECQRQGIGSRLVTQGLEKCRNQEFDLVVVLGYISYFPRIGFKRVSLFNLNNEYNVDENFMVLELKGVLKTVHGVVKYQLEF